jgi:hypothetical protein
MDGIDREFTYFQEIIPAKKTPVIVHRKHEGAVTRHEFLPSSARKHLQLQGGLQLQ